jgi:hypothetical protein
MQLWPRDSLRRNPYRETAFRLARVPSEVTDRTVIAEIISQTRQLIQADPNAHQVLGEPVTTSAINGAERILMDPVARSLEELREPVDVASSSDSLMELQREAEILLKTESAGQPTKSLSDGALGTPELELAAPWGPPGEH